VHAKTVLVVSWLLLGFCRPGTAADTARQLSLEEAVAAAVAAHPALKAADAHIASVQGLLTQAGLRPNPDFAVQTENWRAWENPGFRFGQDLDLFVFGSQTIETGGKRERRIDLARQELKVAQLEKDVIRWKIRQDVRLAWLQAQLAQKELELLQENGRYLEQIVEYHRVRVEQGAIAEAELIRVLLERQRLAIAEQASALEAEGRRISLLKAMGVAPGSMEFRLPDRMPDAVPPADPSLQALNERTNRAHPAAALSRALVERARAQVELEKSLARSDVTFAVGYKRTAGFDTLLGGLSIPIPLFNKNQGNIQYSERDAARAEAEAEGAMTVRTAEIAAALAGVKRRQEMLRDMEKGVLQQSEEALRISLGAYQEGGVELLRLLDAQRVRNEIRLLYTRTQMEYIISLAELEAAVGEESFLSIKE
jgi:cobalt-zinc-cadmium efflux system outer membrane protein